MLIKKRRLEKALKIAQGFAIFIILPNFPFPRIWDRKQRRQCAFRFNTRHVRPAPRSVKASMQLEASGADLEQIAGGKDRLSESNDLDQCHCVKEQEGHSDLNESIQSTRQGDML